MKLTVLDEHGDRHDCDVEALPRIGDRVQVASGEIRYFRVKDVMFRLGTNQIGILIERDANQKEWNEKGGPFALWV